MDTTLRTPGSGLLFDLSTAELAAASGLTFRQVDYYVRRGVLEPIVAGRGAGIPRRFAPDQLPRARLAAALAGLGAPLDVARAALDGLGRDAAAWPAFFFVEPSGRIRLGTPRSAACWWINRDRLLDLERSAAA